MTCIVEASFRNSIILSNVSAPRFSYILVHQDFEEGSQVLTLLYGQNQAEFDNRSRSAKDVERVYFIVVINL